MIDRILGALRSEQRQPAARVDDAELVALARRRDEVGRAAFGALTARHQEWLVRLLHYDSLGDRRDAEDVAQEALVRAYLALERCPRGDGFRAWLRTIATRLALNHRRDARTRRRYHVAFGSDRDLSSRDVARALGDRELVVHVLARMSCPFREILVLRHVEELSIKESAAQLDISVSAAKMRHSRARAEFNRIYWQALRGRPSRAKRSRGDVTQGRADLPARAVQA